MIIWTKGAIYLVTVIIYYHNKQLFPISYRNIIKKIFGTMIGNNSDVGLGCFVEIS